jgi:hypothetical protein
MSFLSLGLNLTRIVKYSSGLSEKKKEKSESKKEEDKILKVKLRRKYNCKYISDN